MVQFLPVLESSTDLLLIQFQVLEASTDPVPVGAASRVSVASFETSHDKMNIFGSNPADYDNRVEPSVTGGKKMARALLFASE